MTCVASDHARLRADEGIVLRSCCTGRYGRHILRSLRLLPAAPPRAIVVFVHGTFQHSRAVELADLQGRALDKGCAWFGLDAPGHGLSGRLGDPDHALAPALVPDVEAFESDLLFFIRTVTSDEAFAALPVVLMGHSWGTSLLTVLLPHLQASLGARLRGACIGSCTCLPPSMPDPRMPSSLEMALLRMRAWLTPEERPSTFTTQKLDLRSLARDPQMRERCAADPLRYLGGERPYLSSASWAAADVYKRAGRAVAKVLIPLHIATGSADRAVSPLCGLHLYCASATPTDHKTFRLLADGSHNLLADPHRETVMDEWMAFVQRALAGEFMEAGMLDG